MHYTNKTLMDISQHLNIIFFTRYLMLNGEATIPGVGRFELNRFAARHDVNQDLITPPVYTVTFNSNKTEMSSSQQDYMMRKLNLNEENLQKESQAFAELMHETLQKDRGMDWPGVGKLTLSEGGSIYFEGIRFEYEFLKAQPFLKKKHTDLSTEEESAEESSIEDQPDEYSGDSVSESSNNSWRFTSLLLFSLVVIILFIRFMLGSFSIVESRYGPFKASYPSSTYKLN